MKYLVDGLFYAVYYLVAVPICLIILVFWVVALVITILLMVVAMVIETWRADGVPARPMAVIERVKEKGPALVGNILTRPLRRMDEKEETQARTGILGFAYSENFTAYTLPALSSFTIIALFIFFRMGGGESENLNIEAANADVAYSENYVSENYVEESPTPTANTYYESSQSNDAYAPNNSAYSSNYSDSGYYNTTMNTN